MNSKDFFSSNHKYRATNQRQVILEEIQKKRFHPSAYEIYELVRKRLPKISMGTIYRNLEILFKNGLIQKIGPVSNQMRYDGITKRHYHIRCVYCGNVVDAPIDAFDSLDTDVGNQTDYDILGHNIEFIGICTECKKRE